VEGKFVPAPVVTVTWIVGFPLESRRWEAVMAEICAVWFAITGDIVLYEQWTYGVYIVEVS